MHAGKLSFTVIYRSKDASLPEEPWEKGSSGEVYFDVRVEARLLVWVNVE